MVGEPRTQGLFRAKINHYAELYFFLACLPLRLSLCKKVMDTLHLYLGGRPSLQVGHLRVLQLLLGEGNKAA